MLRSNRPNRFSTALPSTVGFKSLPARGKSKTGPWPARVPAGGVIYTKDDYTKYRLVFTMRHVAGNPDHQACVLIFCTRPEEGKKALDALGGIQFQVPNGGHWDYRSGQNKSGKGFVKMPHPKFDPKDWCQVEMLVDAITGTAHVAVRSADWQQGGGGSTFQRCRSRQGGPDRVANA